MGRLSLFALQFAKLLDESAIFTSSSDGKHSTRRMGVEETINYYKVLQWGKQVREIEGGEGIDHVVDVGGIGNAPPIASIRPGRGYHKSDRGAIRRDHECVIGTGLHAARDVGGQRTELWPDMNGFPCENLCEKKIPKLAKTCKIDKNVKTLYPVFSLCYCNLRRLESSEVVPENPRVGSSILSLGT